MKEYTVREVADLLGKHEETIKRWVRTGKLPNSYRNSDKEGWRIFESDLLNLNNVITIKQESADLKSEADETELVKLAYKAITLTSPTDDILSILTVVGIKRSLELLLIMQQSATKVKNPDGFLRKAIRENWIPTSIPTKLPKKASQRLYDFSQQDFEDNMYKMESQQPSKIPFYNWLEEQ